MHALIGHTGFVGSNLASQHRFDASFRSTDIGEMRGREFELVVCAGVQAKKWWANANPEEDWRGIQTLLDVLATVRAETFVLISTVDVYPQPAGVTESSSPDGPNHAYGTHRLAAERAVRERFPAAHIVRLPGLFGRHLKKNVIFDLLHDNNLDQINPDGVYQYYHLAHLWADLDKCRREGLPLLNIAAEPVRTADIVARFFPEKADRLAAATPFVANYDMRTDYAALWDSPTPGYLYDREGVLAEIGAFVAEEQGAGAKP